MNDSQIYFVNTLRGEDGSDSHNKALGCLREKKSYVYLVFLKYRKER